VGHWPARHYFVDVIVLPLHAPRNMRRRPIRLSFIGLTGVLKRERHCTLVDSLMAWGRDIFWGARMGNRSKRTVPILVGMALPRQPFGRGLLIGLRSTLRCPCPAPIGERIFLPNQPGKLRKRIIGRLCGPTAWSATGRILIASTLIVDARIATMRSIRNMFGHTYTATGSDIVSVCRAASGPRFNCRPV
jgi:hypothetical protein